MTFRQSMAFRQSVKRAKYRAAVETSIAYAPALGQGVADAIAAAKFGVHPRTVRRWRNEGYGW